MIRCFAMTVLVLMILRALMGRERGREGDFAQRKSKGLGRVWWADRLFGSESDVHHFVVQFLRGIL